MQAGKNKFGLRKYPNIEHEFLEYMNNLGQVLLEETHPLLKWIPKEPVSEGGTESIERLDGSRSTVPFEELRAGASLKYDVSINGDFDGVITMIYHVANEMGGKLVRSLQNTVSEAAMEHGHFHQAEELNVDVVCQILERAELTFNDEGIMDQLFVIPPQLNDKFEQIVSDQRVQAIIDRKRREYFAKKGN
jgi:hypothetical protein